MSNEISKTHAKLRAREIQQGPIQGNLDRLTITSGQRLPRYSARSTIFRTGRLEAPSIPVTGSALPGPVTACASVPGADHFRK
jgi:hypothetical protein